LLLLGVGAYGRTRADAPSEPDPSTTSGEEQTARSDGPQPSEADVAVPVEGAPVRRGTLVVTITAMGEADAWRRTVLLAQVAGRIERVHVHEGDRVGSGALLTTVDPTDLSLAVREARARLRTAEAEFRDLTLFDDRIDDATLRKEREASARAKSGLDIAEIAVQQAQRDLARGTVRAPFGGAVASVRVVSGQQVRPGDEIMTIADFDPIKVEVRVLESEVDYLAPGRPATISFAAFRDERFSGRVETINPLVETDARTARATIVVPNPRGRILPGMFARVSIDAHRFPNRLLVPKSAILERDRRAILFVFDGHQGSEGIAQWRYVTTGVANDSLVEILDRPGTETVRVGETVLTNGHHTLTHGVRVRLTTGSGDAANGELR